MSRAIVGSHQRAVCMSVVAVRRLRVLNGRQVVGYVRMQLNVLQWTKIKLIDISRRICDANNASLLLSTYCEHDERWSHKNYTIIAAHDWTVCHTVNLDVLATRDDTTRLLRRTRRFASRRSIRTNPIWVNRSNSSSSHSCSSCS